MRGWMYLATTTVAAAMVLGCETRDDTTGGRTTGQDSSQRDARPAGERTPDSGIGNTGTRRDDTGTMGGGTSGTGSGSGLGGGATGTGTGTGSSGMGGTTQPSTQPTPTPSGGTER